jgi:hypothetical protein
MKNRKRESCTSGTVRDEDGNILIYSARNAEPIDALRRPASEKRQGTKSRLGGAAAVPRALWGFDRGVGLGEVCAKRSARSLWLEEWVRVRA